MLRSIIERLLLFFSFVVTAAIGIVGGYVFWRWAGETFVSDFLALSPKSHEGIIETVSLIGALISATHFFGFWSWYFDSFQESITTHRLLYSEHAPGLTELSHTAGQIVFASLYMLLSALLPLAVLAVTVYYGVVFANEWIGEWWAWIVGLLLGFTLGSPLSDMARAVLDRVFNTSRLNRELSLGLLFRFNGGGKGRPKGNPARGIVLFFLVAIVLLLLLVAVAGASEPPRTQVQTAGIFDAPGRNVREGWRSGRGYIQQMLPLSGLLEEEAMTNLLLQSLERERTWIEGLQEACLRDQENSNAIEYRLSCSGDERQSIPPEYAQKFADRLPEIPRDKELACSKEGEKEGKCDEGTRYHYWNTSLLPEEAGKELKDYEERMFSLLHALTVSGMGRLTLAMKLQSLGQGYGIPEYEAALSAQKERLTTIKAISGDYDRNPVEQAIYRSELLSSWGLESIDPLNPPTGTTKRNFSL